MDKTRYAGKSVIVTGAASGIGRGVAERLAGEGATLVLADIREGPLREVATGLAAEHGVTATPIIYDAGDPASCRRMVDEAVAAMGRLDVLMNIAGVLDWGHFTDLTDAKWDRMLRINLTGLMVATQQALPHLIATRGAVVNTSSSAGMIGQAYYVGYGTTKGAIISFTKSVAMEYIVQGVRSNAICPGGIESAITEGVPHPDDINLKLWHRIFPKTDRFGKPHDIAAAYAYLGSDEASYVTGAVLAVDDGLTVG